MTPPESQRNPIEELADEFLARYRRGERPALTEYTDQYVELADEIRDLFPALVIMEEAGRRDSLPAPTQSHVPDRVGDYRILREVGRGGMGIVYEAEHEALGRHVALKVLPTHAMLDSRHLARFQREARAAARLHHTNIVPVFGVGKEDTLHFYVMQFIEGLGLHEVLAEHSRQRKPKYQTPVAAQSEESSSIDRGNGRDKTCPVQDATDEQKDRRFARVDLSAEQIAHGLLTGVFERAVDEPNILIAADRVPQPAPELPPSHASVGASTATIHLPGQATTTSLSETGYVYWQSVARIGIQVADALEYASSQGVLHRDIKPSNLLLDSHGTVWVTDFGLAKSSDSDELTGTGDIVGTLRYLAPERLHGQSDVRGDIYSLGVSLYELLTLRPAFEESDRLNLIRQLEHDEPPQPRAIDNAIPRDLETVVMKAIAKDPADRYQSPSELAADLRQFLEDKPIRARRVWLGEHVWRWCRRNRALAGLLAFVVVLLVTMAVGGAVANLLRVERDRAVASEGRAKDAEEETRRLLARAEAAESENKIRSHLAQATALRRTGQAGQRYGCLDEIAAAMRLGPSDELRAQLRNEAIAALSLTDVKVRWQRPKFGLVGFSIDPQFERYAVRDPVTWETVVRRLSDDHQVLSVSKPAGRSWHAATQFSPDGALLAVVNFIDNYDNAVLEVWRIAGSERVLSQPIRSGAVMAALAFHQNGRWLLFCRPDGDLCVWDLAENRELQRVPLGLTPYSICLDSRGARVAANDISTGEVRIVELDGGRELASWHNQVGGRAMAWSADDRLLAVAGLSRIFVWNVPNGELVSVLEGHSNEVIWAEFAHRGYLLATCSWDGTTRFWDAVAGVSLLQAPGAFLRFSHDDQHLVFVDQENIGVWDVASDQARRTLHPSILGNRTNARVHPRVLPSEFIGNGRLLATPTLSGVQLWDSETIEPLGQLDTGVTRRVIVHPSGDSLITAGVAGVLHWPIRRDAADNHELWRIGPPQLLYELAPNEKNWYDVAWLPDHESVAVNDDQVAVLKLENANGQRAAIRQPGRFGPGGLDISVSPDGKWIATGGHKARGIQVWDAATGELERMLPPRFENTQDDTISWICFSPDNRWLVCQATNGSGGGIGYYFWEVGTWEKSHFVGATPTTSVGAVFTPDGERMAAATSQDEITIVESATGRELIRLTTLPTFRSWPAAFHPTSGKLVTVAYPDTVHVWDLELVRHHLASLGLDWEESPSGHDLEPRKPGFRPTESDQTSSNPQIGRLKPTLETEAAKPTHKPLRLMVDSGDTLARAAAARRQKESADHNTKAVTHQRAGRWKEAIDELKKSVQLDSTNALAHNNLAWFLTTCPESELRDIPRAVEHGERAVVLAPNESTYRNTLGVCLYHAGDWSHAIEELLKSEGLAPKKYFAENALFLSMSYWRLGEPDTARSWYSRAIEWLEKHGKGDDSEIQRFRTEADELLRGTSQDP